MGQRDVIWITLESARQDHTSLGGHERDTTPNLRRISEESDGAWFDSCFSHDIWTRPSSASILTGHASSSHQVWSNDAYLPDVIETIPEQFRERGYRTVCVSPNAQLSSATGLDRGFEHFHYLSRSTLREEAGTVTLLRYLANLRRHSAGFTTDTRKHSIGYLSTSIAERHVRTAARNDDPLFLYVHLGDSHHPYVPPLIEQEEFASDLDLPLEEAIETALDMSDDLHEKIANHVPFTTAQWNALAVLYDAGIRYVDRLTGALVETARERLDDPIIVITGDHGELFGEHGCLAHMLVANTAVSEVPMVIAGIDGLSGRNRGLVQHADIMQAVVSECGLNYDVPIGRDPRTSDRSIAVTQRGGVRADETLDMIRQHNKSFDDTVYPKGDVTSIRTEEYRYQWDDSGGELFALPDETVDVSNTEPAVARRLRKQYEDWIDEFGQPSATADTSAEFSPEMQQQLRDLGYL